VSRRIAAEGLCAGGLFDELLMATRPGESLTVGSGATIPSLRSPAWPRNGLLAIFFP
jgi:hypothetical protein